MKEIFVELNRLHLWDRQKYHFAFHNDCLSLKWTKFTDKHCRFAAFWLTGINSTKYRESKLWYSFHIYMLNCMFKPNVQKKCNERILLVMLFFLYITWNCIHCKYPRSYSYRVILQSMSNLISFKITGLTHGAKSYSMWVRISESAPKWLLFWLYFGQSENPVLQTLLKCTPEICPLEFNGTIPMYVCSTRFGEISLFTGWFFIYLWDLLFKYTH